MTNEIPIVSRETKNDTSSFTNEENVRILEMSLVSFDKQSASVNKNDFRKNKIQASFSTIFEDNEHLKDEDIFY